MMPLDHELLRKLEASVYLFLEHLLGLGEVVIVTNAQKGWVEQSCHAVFPTVKSLLTKCRVVSARANFEHLFPESPAKVGFMLYHYKYGFCTSVKLPRRLTWYKSCCY
jgi:hypothetical protein